jgi:hypothetical protein
MCIVAAAAAPILGMTAAQVGTASLVASALGGLMTVYGQIQQGKAADASAKYQAAVDRNNAILSDRKERDAILRGNEEERRQRVETSQRIGLQRASFAENNIDLGSDSVIDTLSDTAMTGELDALTIRNNAQREASGYAAEGMNYRASAENELMAGKNAKKASKINATASILGTASTVSDRWAGYKTEGVFE